MKEKPDHGQSVTIAGRDVCGTAGSLPYGADYLPIDAICSCMVAEESAESELLSRLEGDLVFGEEAVVGFFLSFLRFSIGKCRNCPFFRAF